MDLYSQHYPFTLTTAFAANGTLETSEAFTSVYILNCLTLFIPGPLKVDYRVWDFLNAERRTITWVLFIVEGSVMTYNSCLFVLL